MGGNDGEDILVPDIRDYRTFDVGLEFSVDKKVVDDIEEKLRIQHLFIGGYANAVGYWLFERLTGVKAF